MASDLSGWIEVLPFYGFGFLIVLTDVAHEFFVQVLDRCENPSRDDIALDLSEPQFDLIDPRGIRWGEMQVDVGVTGKELFDLGRFVRGEIVGDDMDLFALGLMSDDIGKEGHELCRGVALSRFAQNFASAGVESSIQRKGAMTEVLKAVTFGSSRESGRTGSLRSNA